MVLNTWNHVCITYKYIGLGNNIAKLFVDGILVNTDTLVQNIGDPGTQATYIGFESMVSPDPSFHFNGKIDDIGIWNRALTQQEITTLYNSCANT